MKYDRNAPEMNRGVSVLLPLLNYSSLAKLNGQLFYGVDVVDYNRFAWIFGVPEGLTTGFWPPGSGFELMRCDEGLLLRVIVRACRC